jgi:hypothetical protein
MNQLILLKPGLASEVSQSGNSVQVADATMGINGGVIVNPRHGKDQGLAVVESLFVSLFGPQFPPSAATGIVEIVPGQTFLVPKNTNVWVNAASAGHKFTAYFTSPLVVQYPPTVVPGDPASDVPGIAAEPGTQPFPPGHVTGLTTVIPSYLYQEYTDDDDCQGWVEAQNIMQQDYVDTFNALNLPIYTGGLISGALLDWVGRGLYGMTRPSLGSGRPNLMGPLNTYGMNWLVPMWDFSALLSFEGNWRVAANSPNLTPVNMFPFNGMYWNATTANPAVPETAPAGLPGISGLTIQQGDKILWNAPAGNNPSSDEFQPYYLQIRSAAIEAKFGLNEISYFGPEDVYLTNDDTYRRILTWHFYKADGNYFSTEFIKRRVWRFLYGANGLSTDYAVDSNGYIQRFSGNTQPSDDFMADKRQISVTLGVDRNVTIRFVLGKRTIGPEPLPFPPSIHAGNGGAMMNYLGANGFNPAFEVTPPWDIGFETKGGVTMNDLETSYEKYGPLPFMYIFKQALDLGVLEVPYQYNFTCYIG